MNKEKEIETVTLMVRRYCWGVHGTRGGALCPACNALLEYARQRRDRCPHGEIQRCCEVLRESQGGNVFRPGLRSKCRFPFEEV